MKDIFTFKYFLIKIVLNSMIETYSIVIHPQDPIISLIKDLKNKLKIKIGNYGSSKSMAHITILHFDATDEQLKYVIENLVRIVQKECIFDAVFNKIIYSNTSKCIFLSPDKTSKIDFKKLSGNIRKKIKGYNNTSSVHLTIGRELKPEQLEKSKGLFPDVEFNFHCDRIALRKLNKNIGQFEIIQIFNFSGKSNPEEAVQMSIDWDC